MLALLPDIVVLQLRWFPQSARLLLFESSSRGAWKAGGLCFPTPPRRERSHFLAAQPTFHSPPLVRSGMSSGPTPSHVHSSRWLLYECKPLDA